jgi:hypothetical protein
LLARLADPAPVLAPHPFPLGTLQPDGRLDLCKQALAPASAAALAGTLTGGHRVRTLYLGCNHIDAAGLAPLTRVIATDATVRALWLKRNPIGDDGVRALAEALTANHSVRTLDLTNTGVTAHGIAALVDALLARPAPIERLYAGGNGLGPVAATHLARLLRGGGTRELYLAAGSLGDDGAEILAAAIRAGGTPVTLGLGGNGIGVAGVRALAARLSAIAALDLARPPSSLVLRAAPNAVGDDGAAVLAAALPGSPLRRLDLRHTGVTGRGARLLLAALTDAGPGRLAQLWLGAGVPRRIKREVAALLATVPAAPPAEDVRAIASVYR